MIATLMLFACLGAAVFLFARSKPMLIRASLAIATFAVPSLLFSVWLVRVGDEAPPDARTVQPAELASGSAEQSNKTIEPTR
jgi:hypothetical protein